MLGCGVRLVSGSWAGLSRFSRKPGGGSLVQLLLSHLFLICPCQDAFLRICRSNQSLPDCVTTTGDFCASCLKPSFVHLLCVPSAASFIAHLTLDLLAKDLALSCGSGDLPAHPTTAPQPAAFPSSLEHILDSVRRNPQSFLDKSLSDHH